MEFMCVSVKFRILVMVSSNHFYPQYRISQNRWGYMIERDSEIQCFSLYEAMQYIEMD